MPQAGADAVPEAGPHRRDARPARVFDDHTRYVPESMPAGATALHASKSSVTFE